MNLLKQLLFVSFFFLSGNVVAQIGPYTCDAPNDIKKMYWDDAIYLSNNLIFSDSLSYMDSVDVPPFYLDTVLWALLAVYNAHLPATDSVIGYKIHSFALPLNPITVEETANASWVKQLRLGNIPTGDIAIDSLMEKYSLKPIRRIRATSRQVDFGTDLPVNPNALAKAFRKLPTVKRAFEHLPVMMHSLGKSITAKRHPDYITLTYYLGWGDCPAGCTASHQWVFNVYFDWSVEVVSSTGQQP